MSKDTEQPKNLPPLPKKKVASAKPKAEGRTPKTEAPTGPTVADFEALKKQLEQVQAQQAQALKSLEAQKAALKARTDEVLLLRAGMDPRWTDPAILQAFDGASVTDGPLGAVLAVLSREVVQCQEDAEAHENRGDRAAVPAYVQACARLKIVRDKVIGLYEQANALEPEEVPGQRASRYVE